MTIKYTNEIDIPGINSDSRHVDYVINALSKMTTCEPDRISAVVNRFRSIDAFLHVFEISAKLNISFGAAGNIYEETIKQEAAQ